MSQEFWCKICREHHSSGLDEEACLEELHGELEFLTGVVRSLKSHLRKMIEYAETPPARPPEVSEEDAEYTQFCADVALAREAAREWKAAAE